MIFMNFINNISFRVQYFLSEVSQKEDEYECEMLEKNVYGQLPDEILVKMANNLPLNDIAKFHQVNKKTARVFEDTLARAKIFFSSIKKFNKKLKIDLDMLPVELPQQHTEVLIGKISNQGIKYFAFEYGTTYEELESRVIDLIDHHFIIALITERAINYYRIKEALFLWSKISLPDWTAINLAIDYMNILLETKPGSNNEEDKKWMKLYGYSAILQAQREQESHDRRMDRGWH